jgi:hypothetical protein
MANAYDATGQNEIDELLASLSQSNVSNRSIA